MLRKVQFCLLLLCLFTVPAVCQTAPASQGATEARVDSMLKQLSLEEKIDLIGGVDDFYIRAIPRIGLPRLKMADGPVGVRNYGPSTVFGGIGLAATWDPALAQRIGTVIGEDARARGVHFMLGPGVNIYRAPLCGRNFEYFGEDPFLSGRIAAAYIQGMQKQGVSATVKHFLGNNSEYDRHNVEAEIDERTMREIYLPAFEAAVKIGHVASIMDSYNLVNGYHLTQNPYLNKDVVKSGWNFDGLIISDWSATYDGVEAANAGMDIEMPSGAYMNSKTLLPAIETGKVTVATIDDKVRRILRVAMRFGWMDRAQTDLTIPAYNVAGKNAALQTAREGMVLLKNDSNLLPVSRGSIRSIALLGPDAHPAIPSGGGSASVKPFAAVSFLDGLTNALGQSASVYYHRGIPKWSQLANSTAFTTAGGRPGLQVEVFGNKDFSGSPVATRIDEHINVRPPFTVTELLAGEVPEVDKLSKEAHDSSTRWSGLYSAAAAGSYRVFVESPTDGVAGFRLSIDGKPVIDDWKLRKAIIDQNSIELSAGKHQVVFERYQTGFNFLGDLVRVGIVPATGLVDPAAKALAAKADLVVLAVGYDNDSESEGGDRTFGLPIGQDELIREISAVNKKVVVVVTSGGNVDSSKWLPQVSGLIQAWYPGQEGGTALAEILLGDVNPSGRLPFTFEKRWEDNPAHDSYYPEPGTRRVVYRSGVFVGYRGYEHNGTQPLFPFGYGLSYTAFKYGNLSLKQLDGAGKYEVSFDVTNTGKREGAEVAQIYVGANGASVPRPAKELKAFSKVTLRPGETKRVSVELDPRSFAYFDVPGKQWKADAGDYEVLVGHSSAEIELRHKVTLERALTIAVGE